MDRRRFMACAGALAVAGPAMADLPVPAGNQMAFKILRNGTIVGEHHLQFTPSGDDLTVDININAVVKVLGITAFTYGVKMTEQWSGGVFQSLDSYVNDNGNPLEVHGKKTDAGYTVFGINHNNPAKNLAQYIAPPDTLPLTYWNKAMLAGTLLNPQTAHSYKVGPEVQVATPGWNNLQTANGGSLTAQRFDLTGKLILSVWYDQQNRWSSLEFHKSGDFTYQKIT